MSGFGFQSHFGSPQPIETVAQVVERYAQAFPKLDFAVSEFDVNTADESMQADYTRDFTTYVFSHPRFTDFLMWGFWERRHWLPAGSMYRTDWTSKANAVAWNNLWSGVWWTNLAGASDAEGAFAGRAFKGTYQITVRQGGRVQTVTEAIREDRDIIVRLP